MFISSDLFENRDFPSINLVEGMTAGAGSLVPAPADPSGGMGIVLSLTQTAL